MSTSDIISAESIHCGEKSINGIITLEDSAAHYDERSTNVVVFEDGTHCDEMSINSITSEDSTKRHYCKICGHCYKRKESCNAHHRDVHSNDITEKIIFPCNLCSKTFSNKRSLKNHIKRHCTSYVCDVCTKQFKDKGSLEIHKRVHTGEKPFSCNVCNKHFADKRAIRCHLRVHTGEKPFACDCCDKKFAQKSSLITHRLNDHHL